MSRELVFYYRNNEYTVCSTWIIWLCLLFVISPHMFLKSICEFLMNRRNKVDGQAEEQTEEQTARQTN